MNSYLSWMASQTKTCWNNDSAIDSQVDAALAQGAIGATTNPPLSFEALTTQTAVYGEKLAAIDKTLPDNEYAFRAMTLVAKHFSEKFMKLHEERGGLYGTSGDLAAHAENRPHRYSAVPQPSLLPQAGRRGRLV